MKSLPPPQFPGRRARRRDGVALIIVLAFVVIITGVILAFFSRSLANRAISNASANQSKADLLAQGATEDIIGNLQEEIAAGSTTATMLTGTATVYTPSSPSAMVPQLDGLNGISSPAPNLVLRSANGQNFYNGGSVTIPCNAAGGSSTTPSLNGRSVSLARWNAPYFLPLATGSDATPLSGSFAAPDWVLVARNGSNPTSVTASTATSATNGTTVVGRYAYAVYNEGNLLDANVAGYPSSTSTNEYASKPALAYADLTQVGLTGTQVNELVAWRNYASALVTGTSYLTPNFPVPTTTAGLVSGSNYYNFVTSNPSGFLAVSSTSLNYKGVPSITQGQSDRLFGSRQEFIAFMQNALGLTGTSLNTLNYFTTFSRGLDQPSVWVDATRPTVAAAAADGGNNAQNQDTIAVNSTRPINPSLLTVRVTGTFTRNDGSTAVIGEPLVKKRFALSRLAWLTYLGPSATRTIYAVGAASPGVTSKDYDMWALTNLYGVSPAYLQQGTAANIQKYFGLVWQLDNSTNQPGQTAAKGQPVPASSFLDNEYKWFYYGGHVFATGTGGPISRVVDIANLGTGARDPDFFELLKATVSAGSKAGGSMSLASISTQYSTAGSTHPYYYQTVLDTNLDYAIMQLGVNIIDQFKVDGYSTRIVFWDGSDPVHEFRGVENLPYLYRFNTASMKLRMENPQLSPAQYLADTLTESGTTVLKDTGVCLLMHIPTIWNPHDENAPLGDPAPAGPNLPTTVTSGTNFRLIVDSVSPDGIQSAATATAATGYNYFNANASNNSANNTVAAVGSSDYAPAVLLSSTLYTTGPLHTGAQISPPMGVTAGPSYPLDPANSCLAFSVPNGTLFREPTPLARYNLPAGSLLQFGVAPLHITQNNVILNQNGGKVFTYPSGFISDSPNPLYLPAANNPTQTLSGYVGICAGLYPVIWQLPITGGTEITISDHPAVDVYNGVGPFVTYRLQYKDPNPADTAGGWVTYDEKYTKINATYVDTAFGSPAVDGGSAIFTGNLVNQADKSPGSDWQSYADPRSSRFSAVNGRNIGGYGQTPGGMGEWLDPTNAVSFTDRPDNNAGYGIADYRSGNDGEYWPIKADTWTVTGAKSGLAASNSDFFRIGLLEQNSTTATDNGIRFSGDGSGGSGNGNDGPTFYPDPDGVVRGAMGNYVPAGTTPASTTVGLPLATSYPAGYTPTSGTPYQGQSRPYMLHRPFRSVAELGYVFSGTPWKNIDLFTPQSGDSGLLDVFTAYEPPNATSNPNPLVAGVVNLNTQQVPVLQAILSGASIDEVQTSGSANTGFLPITPAQANALLTTSGNTLPTRTASTANGQGPLRNVSELVGSWIGPSGAGAAGYSGPIGDLTPLYSSGGFPSTNISTMQYVDRFRESFIRPLAAVGNTRVWNLMIDVIAQTGRYPQGNTSAANFVVDGEQRYWVHIAIDRLTGQVLDKQVEIVKD